MSKLNNLIGFWNSKSLDQEENKSQSSPKPSRPKSEIIDRNFVKRMENFSAVETPRQRGGVRFLSEEREDGVRPGALSDDKTRVHPERDSTTERTEKSEIAGSAGKRGLAQSTPASPAWSTKPQSPFAKFQQLENNFGSQNGRVTGSRTPPLTGSRGTNLYRNASMPASTARPTVTHKMMEQKSPGTKSSLAARSGSGAKEMILMWVQNRIKEYPIPMTNFSTHWNDGLAFCALIHVFYPDNFDWFSLKSENRRHNFTLAFQKAEELAGIYPLLEVDDMVKFQKPDWKCVFTYVQSFYRRFRDGRSPPPRSALAAGAAGELKLSEVARAVAECQEDQVGGAKIVKQISQEKPDAVRPKSETKVESETKEVSENNVESETKEEVEERPAESVEVSCDLAVRAAEDTPVTPEEKREVHTESACITLKPSPSPAKLSPKFSSGKMCRSKSVASEHPDTKSDSTHTDRKLSFNHPMPSMSPPALQL